MKREGFLRQDGSLQIRFHVKKQNLLSKLTESENQLRKFEKENRLLLEKSQLIKKVLSRSKTATLKTSQDDFQKSTHHSKVLCEMTLNSVEAAILGKRARRSSMSSIQVGFDVSTMVPTKRARLDESLSVTK